MAQPTAAARLAVDIGGTFTDLAVESGGKLYARKVLTTTQAPTPLSSARAPPRR
jgi:N-methylhydantoinase A